MKRFIAIALIALIAGGSLAACGKKARLRTPSNERARQERESGAEKIETFSDERFEENAARDDSPDDAPKDGDGS
ncbi:MAG: hypothetical protein AAFX08_07945 [Pseudomonadota bacterium]